MTNKTLKLFVTNAFGLMSKLDEFRHVLHAESPDVAIVTESKLSEAVTQAELTLPGYYQPLRRDRNRHGGGVAVWVKATLAMNELDTIDVFGQELVWLNVKLSTGRPVAICAAYRPGTCSDTDTSIFDVISSARASLHSLPQLCCDSCWRLQCT
eukprot:scpid81003/ scgid29410/ 